jgi:plasmid stabilization system protein ParE
VFETASMLEQFPLAGKIIESHSPRLQQLRRFPLSLPFGNWLILYRVSASGVLILRVIHGAQDWPRAIL